MEVLDQLKEIGIDELHEKTHISIHSLKIILERRYDAINTIQFRGFLSIIEGNLNINMDPLRDDYDAYKQTLEEPEEEHANHTILPSENPKEKLIFIIAGVLIFIIATFYFLSGESEETQTPTPNYAVKQAKAHLEDINESTKLAHATKTSSSVTSFNPNEAQTSVEDNIVEQPFVLHPKDKLWIGVINLKTGEKIDTITDKDFPLDENADLLISLGHGYVDIELYGETEKLTDRGRVRLLYKDGKLTHISASKFKELNKGQSW